MGNLDSKTLFEIGNAFEKFEKDQQFDPSQIDIDGENIVHIDMDAISKDSEDWADDIVNTITRVYFDDSFLNENPALKKRIRSEVDSFRLLIKMLRADEQTHDLAIRAIGANSGNASLYRAAAETQKTIMSLQEKITATFDRITNLLKNYQLEINFDNVPQGDDDSVDNHTDMVPGVTCRGSKEFIEQMNRGESE